MLPAKQQLCVVWQLAGYILTKKEVFLDMMVVFGEFEEERVVRTDE